MQEKEQRLFELNFGNIRKGGNQSQQIKETIANIYNYYTTREDYTIF